MFGGSMGLFSMSKRWTAVIAIVFTMGTFGLKCFGQNPSKSNSAPPPAVAKPSAPANTNTAPGVTVQTGKSDIEIEQQKRESVHTAIKDATDKCENAKKEEEKKKADFFGACKEEETTSKSSSAEIIKKCSSFWSECSKIGDEERAMTKLMGGSLGTSPGMNPMEMFMEDSETKKCSKLSPDSHKSAVDKVEASLDTRRDKLNEAIRKAQERDKDAKKDIEEGKKEFQKAQKEKTGIDKQRKDEALNKKNAFNEKMAQFETNITKIEREIIEAQVTLKNFVKVRSHQVIQYQLDLEACRAKAEEVREQQLKKSPLVGSNQAAQQSMSKRIYNICRNQVLTKREADAENYTSQKRLAEDSIQRKYKELDNQKANIQKFQQMYQTSEQNTQIDQLQEDQEFLSGQQQSFLRIEQMVNDAKSASFESQRQIQEASTQVNSASNKLSLLEAEEPVGDKDKGLGDMKKAMLEFQGLNKTRQSICKQAQDTIERRSKEIGIEAPKLEGAE